jgi:hypothetical protein
VAKAAEAVKTRQGHEGEHSSEGDKVGCIGRKYNIDV